MTSVEQHESIRRLYYLEHKSARHIAKELGISRRTVGRALATDAAPTYTLSKPRPAPRLGDYKKRLNELLVGNKHLPRKQRYTAHRMFQTLQAEGYAGSESSVQSYCVHWKKEHKRPPVFIPLEFEPGQDAQVDWGEAQAVIAGQAQTVQVFVMRLNYSRRTFVMAFPAQKQEAFFEGHVQAFSQFGGVPSRLSYDNLAAAVQMVFTTSNSSSSATSQPTQAQERKLTRRENEAFVAFRSYYLFQSHFCTPAQGHEKGGVEHAVGFSRRNFLVPIPQVASFTALNQYLLTQCQQDEVRIVSGQSQSIGQAFRAEQAYLRPLPLHPFECCRTRQVTLNPYSQVVFETNRYSVPVEQARTHLSLRAYPFRVDILHESAVIASHPRCYGEGQDIFDPLHYLSLLEQRPGAFEYARPLKAWRAGWPPSYQRLLTQLQQKWPQSGRGVKEFVQILRLHQKYAPELVEAAIEKALSYGSYNLEAVVQCLFQLQQPQQLKLPLLDLSDKPHLAGVGQQEVDLHCYEQLLKKRG